jgi:hypothetical protein
VSVYLDFLTTSFLYLVVTLDFQNNPRPSIGLEIRAHKPSQDINSRLFLLTKKGLKTTKILAFGISAYKETASSSPCALFRNTQYYYALFCDAAVGGSTVK